MKKTFKSWLSEWFLYLAFELMPDGPGKLMFAEFLQSYVTQELKKQHQQQTKQ